MAKEANCAFFAVGDEADGLAVERLQTWSSFTQGGNYFATWIQNTYCYRRRSFLKNLLGIWRLTIDASANGHGDSVAFMTQPRWDYSAEAACRSAGGNDQ